jgi:hypothetical protein
MLTYADAAPDSDGGTFKALTQACMRAYLRDIYLNY